MSSPSSAVPSTPPSRAPLGRSSLASVPGACHDFVPRPSSMRDRPADTGIHRMRSHLPALAVLTIGLLAGCSTDAEPAGPAAATPSSTVWDGPSGLEVESEQAARAALEARRVEAERVEAERVAAEAAAQAAAAEAAQRAAEEAAAQAVIEAEGGCP